MGQVVPIGRFSRMTRLSVKALRHYDEIGLLSPAHVDPSSGYRYYEPGQANRAEAIRLLRSVDMPLGEIHEVLAAGDVAEAEVALKRHRDRLASRLAEHERMLAYLDVLMNRETIMPYDVQVDHVDERTVAALRTATDLERIGADIGAGFGRLAHALGAAGIEPVGAPYVAYLDIIDEETSGEIEVCIPVPPGVSTDDDAVEVRTLPAEPVATTVHHGAYPEIGPAYHTLAGWISEHGHEMTGPPREIYLNDPREIAEDQQLTRVEWPIDAEVDPG